MTSSSPRCRVLLVGPGVEEAGGVASVLVALSTSRLAESYALTFVATAGNGGRWRRVCLALGGLSSAVREMLSRPYPLVHVHVASNGSFWRKAVVVLAARVLGRSVVLQLHGGKFDSFAAAGSPLRRYVVARVFAAADVVIALSPLWEQRIATFSSPRRIEIVPNGVVVPPCAAERPLAPRIVFVGRLAQGKGVGVLLDSLAMLKEEGRTVQAVMCGDGDVQGWRERAARQGLCVTMPGWVSSEDVRATLAHGGLFCLPSFDEGVPVALLEAMSYGLPCVATRVGGIPDVVTDGVDGLLVPAGDAVALAQALSRVLVDEDLACSLGARARETVRSRFSLDQTVRDITAIYESLGWEAATVADAA